MATQPETLLKVKALRELRKLKRLWCVKTQFVAHCGIPDIIGVYRGRFFAWELKAPGKKATKLQKYVLARIKAAGGHVAVVWPDTLDEELKRLRRCK